MLFRSLRKQLLSAALPYYDSFIREHRADPAFRAELAATYFRIAILTFEMGPEEDWVPAFKLGVSTLEELLRTNPDVSEIQSTATKLQMQLKMTERKKEVEEERLRKEAQKQIDQSAVDLNAAIRHVQNQYKFWSVFLPPMLPLAVAFFVYFNRRAKEREGVSKARLR